MIKISDFNKYKWFFHRGYLYKLGLIPRSPHFHIVESFSFPGPSSAGMWPARPKMQLFLMCYNFRIGGTLRSHINPISLKSKKTELKNVWPKVLQLRSKKEASRIQPSEIHPLKFRFSVTIIPGPLALPKETGRNEDSQVPSQTAIPADLRPGDLRLKQILPAILKPSL